ncbi:WAT1-related protein At1g68170-like [Phoenix dactylifera]|uniref:WAT1-related protein n=1 Tax=Phoenix dactylifera TaxID=42345 RepID=A0A8B8J0W2_PHODC|nr:WAT1-related protein At1g68170-like [Phoenix dactylifera]
MGGRSFRDAVEETKPAALMVLVQVAFAGLNIFCKLALNDGMDVRVLVAYRYIFAITFIGPLAFFLERKSRPSLTWMILLQSFLCGLFGGTLAQNLYVASLKLTSATFANALSNLMPASTFILAVSFRLEILRIRQASGQAKVLGTLVGLGGATLLTFYKGPEINPWSTNLNLLKIHQEGDHHQALPHEPSKRIMGAFLVIASCFFYSLWLIIQAKMSRAYPCHYSSSALMNLMGAIQTILIALCTNRDMNKWRLGFDVRLLTISYAGVVASGLIIAVLMWCIKKKGPLYTSVFNPLQLVIVALLSSPLLGERLHLGSILGAVLIVIGLYLVLWGKKKEATVAAEKSLVEAKSESVEVVTAPRPAESSGAKNISEPNNKEEETLALRSENIGMLNARGEELKTNAAMP